MRKLKTLFVAVVAATALAVPAAPAHASCDTELGDMCKFMDFVCATNPTVTQLVCAYCRRWAGGGGDGWAPGGQIARGPGPPLAKPSGEGSRSDGGSR